MSQDRVVVIERAGTLLVVVADGMGGRPGGDVASAAFVEAVQAAADGVDTFDVRGWSALFREVDERLAKGLIGETTALVVAVADDALAGVSVGDGEAWLVGRKGVERVTAKQGRARLGSGHASPTPFFARMNGRTLVAATDGLFRPVPVDAIVRAVAAGSVAEIAARLTALPRLSTGAYADDLAVAVIVGTGEDRH